MWTTTASLTASGRQVLRVHVASTAAPGLATVRGAENHGLVPDVGVDIGWLHLRFQGQSPRGVVDCTDAYGARILARPLPDALPIFRRPYALVGIEFRQRRL